MKMASVALVAATMFASGAASAADITKAQCVDANTSGQNSRREGKLGDARAQFLVCNDPKCPEIVRTDCLQRFEEADAAGPAIVFDVKGSNRGDLAAVKISADGKVLAEKADGTPLKVDPGAHDFTFEAAGEKPLTKTFVLKEGEKLRRETISFAPEAPVASPLPPPPAENGDGRRVLGIALGAAGVVGLAFGVIGGLEASAGWNDQKRDCIAVSNCRDHAAALDDHGKAETWGTISTVGFIAGALLVAGGAVLYFTAPSQEAKTAQLRNPLRFSF